MKGKRTATAFVALGLCLALIAPVGVAWAYFTSYASTKGSVPITLGAQTDISEDFSNEFGNWTKTLSISNLNGSSAVFVRVKAFSGSAYELTYMGDDAWVPGENEDGFYYYTDPVQPGGKTAELKVIINNIPVNAKENDEFNVVVVYETTLALYDANGKAYANWDAILDTGTATGGSGTAGGDTNE